MKRKEFLFLIGIFLALLASNIWLFPWLPQAAYAAVQSPAGYLHSKLLAVGNYGRAWWRAGQLAEENRRWREENNRLLAEAADANRLQGENELLRGQLAVSRRLTRQLRLAKIFASQSGPLLSTLLIDQGERAGLAPGMAVVDGGNILIGNVAEVYLHSALVWRLDDPRSQVSVRLGKPDVIGRLRGGAGGLTVELITNQESVAVGDLVTTSGLDRLPAGLAIGTVSQTDLRGGNLFWDIRVEPRYRRPVQPEIFVIISQ